MSQYTPEQLEHHASNLAQSGFADIAAMLRAYAATLRQPAARVDESLWAAVDRMIVDAWKLGGCEKTLDMLAMRARFEAALSAQPAPERQGDAKPVACRWITPAGIVYGKGWVAYDGASELPESMLKEGWRKELAYTHPAAPVGVPDGDAAIGRAYKRWYAAAKGFRNVVADAAHELILREAERLAAAPSAPQGTQQGEG